MDSINNPEKELRTYLKDIKEVLEVLKKQVGKTPPEGKSWFANIDDDGAFPEVGILNFSRHGAGIYIKWNQLELDFDFIDFELIRDKNLIETEEVINIQPWKFFSYLKSKGVNSDKTIWEVELNKLVENEVLVKKGSQFYFIDDLNKLQLTKAKTN